MGFLIQWFVYNIYVYNYYKLVAFWFQLIHMNLLVLSYDKRQILDNDVLRCVTWNISPKGVKIIFIQSHVFELFFHKYTL